MFIAFYNIFYKDQYWKKALYAAKVNADNEEILLEAGMSEEEIEVLIDLSHIRHKLHSARSVSDELIDCYDEIGHQYSADETLVDKANRIAAKYNLPTIPNQEIPEVFIDDDYDMIADYFGVSVEEVQKDYEENTGEYHQAILLEWEKAKDKTSHDIRVFFYHVNKKYNTDFPDAMPDEWKFRTNRIIKKGFKPFFYCYYLWFSMYSSAAFKKNSDRLIPLTVAYSLYLFFNPFLLSRLILSYFSPVYCRIYFSLFVYAAVSFDSFDIL